MGLDERILARLDELIERGEQTRPQYISGPYESDYRMQSQPVNEWGISCLNLFTRIYGPDSLYASRFGKLLGPRTSIDQFEAAFGILRAARDDYAHDMLFDTRVVIAAEVFDDFLEQADHLHSQGYYQAAAVIAGAVLEDGLRKLCDRKGIAQPQNGTINPLNDALAKARIYTKLVQKQVTALADIRNNAAHGKLDQFTAADVADMLRQVRGVMTHHFS